MNWSVLCKHFSYMNVMFFFEPAFTDLLVTWGQCEQVINTTLTWTCNSWLHVKRSWSNKALIWSGIYGHLSNVRWIFPCFTLTTHRQELQTHTCATLRLNKAGSDIHRCMCKYVLTIFHLYGYFVKMELLTILLILFICCWFWRPLLTNLLKVCVKTAKYNVKNKTK